MFLFSENVSGSLKKAKLLLIKLNNIERYHFLREMLCTCWEAKNSTSIGKNQEKDLQ